MASRGIIWRLPLTVKLTFFGDFFQTATFFLGCFRPGEKVSKEVTAGIILVCCKFGQHIFQIFVDPESVCFCSLYQAVHDGAGFCSADGIYVDPVLPPEGEGTDGAFCGIDFPISQEEPKIFLLVQTVLERLVGTASSGDFWKRFFYPSEISVNFWRDLTLTVIFPVFIFGFIAKPVQVEQLGDQLHTLCGNGSFEFRNIGGFYEFRILSCFLYNKNTNYCRGQSSKLQREFPYYCRALFGIFLSPQFL